MTVPATLYRYFAVCFLVNILFAMGVLLGIVYLFETIELLRRAGDRPDVTLWMVLQMSLFKIPEVGQILFPFAILFSAIYTFWTMNRKQELVVIRAAGFSVWQFLAPVMAVALAVGVFNITILNPVGAALLSKYEAMEDERLANRRNYVTLLREGIWLRQVRPSEGGHVILHAGRIDINVWELSDVLVLFFDADDLFERRIDAPTARLTDGQWVFKDARDYTNDQNRPAYVPVISLPTDLTTAELEDSFSSPSSLSFWALPGFIRTMDMTGFDATPLRIHYQSLLSQPLLFLAMVLLAACVSLRPPRLQGTFIMILVAVFAGFVIFFLSSFLQALGASQQIPLFLAAWAPAIVSCLLGVSVILNTEDG